MRDIAYSQEDRDIVLENGNIVFVDSIDMVVQRCIIRLEVLQGEDPWDLTFGIPTWTRVLGKRSGLVDVRQEFARLLEGVPGVQAVTDLKVSYDRKTRKGTLSGKIRVSDGSLRDIGGEFS